MGGCQEINGLLKGDEDIRVENISKMLSPWASALFDFLPVFIKKQVCTWVIFSFNPNV